MNEFLTEIDVSDSRDSISDVPKKRKWIWNEILEFHTHALG